MASDLLDVLNNTTIHECAMKSGDFPMRFISTVQQFRRRADKHVCDVPFGGVGENKI